MKHFRTLTTGHTVLMGRRTFESLPKGALPRRRNIVISRRPGAHFDGCETYPSLPSALEHCSKSEKVFVIGGASVYAEAFPMASYLELTLVHAVPAEADVFFPVTDMNEWEETARESHSADEANEQAFDFVTYRRKSLHSAVNTAGCTGK